MTNYFLSRRLAWQAIAWCSIGLGTAGLVVPLLPTTPFLLLAAWAASKGSPQLENWLAQHRIFGPVLFAWRAHQAVPKNAKIASIVLMMLSWAGLWLLRSSPVVLVLTFILFFSVAVFLLSRPTAKVFSPCSSK